MQNLESWPRSFFKINPYKTNSYNVKFLKTRIKNKELQDSITEIYNFFSLSSLRPPCLRRDKPVANTKSYTIELLDTLKKEKLKAENWREKETTRDAVRPL